MTIYLAGLQGIPPELYEAATIDGAGSVKRFFNITVPMLRPVTFFLFITGMIQNFNMFEQIQIMTLGGPVNTTSTVVHQIYNRAFESMLFGYAAAQSVILLLIIAIVTLINFKYGQKGVDTSL
jgi:ABC-type sugar transport system permease subunit